MSNEALLDILDGFVGERDGVDCELTNWKLGDYECELYRLPKSTVCAAALIWNISVRALRASPAICSIVTASRHWKIYWKILSLYGKIKIK